MLSDDDLNPRTMSDEELDAAWDLWFDLAQETNAFDPAYSHGVLVGWPLTPSAFRARNYRDLPPPDEPSGPIEAHVLQHDASAPPNTVSAPQGRTT